MNKIQLQEGESIIAAVPEYASGPGWANQPIWVHIVDRDHHHRVECLQPEEQNFEMRILFRLAYDAHWSMINAVRSLIVHSEGK